MRHTTLFSLFIAVAVISVITPNSPLCEEPVFENGEFVIYCAALELSTDGSPWKPTLYKIDLRRAELLDQFRIADEGAPIRLFSESGNHLQIAVSTGVFANGTVLRDKEYTIIYQMNPDEKRSEMISKTEGMVEEYYGATPLSIELFELGKRHQLSEQVLHYAEKPNRIVTIEGGNRQEPSITLKVYDTQSRASQVLLTSETPGNKTGVFKDPRTTQVVQDRWLVTFFTPESKVAHYVSSYVVIVDLQEKTVRWVEIGSDTASGLVVQEVKAKP